MEVFLFWGHPTARNCRLLHVRGGVSVTKNLYTIRCEVFSTSVEVFLRATPAIPVPKGLLHDRGGVSPAKQFVELSKNVFSTSVEVFSLEKLAGRSQIRLLH